MRFELLASVVCVSLFSRQNSLLCGGKAEDLYSQQFMQLYLHAILPPSSH